MPELTFEIICNFSKPYLVHSSKTMHYDILALEKCEAMYYFKTIHAVGEVQAILYHVHVELALQKPLITHETRMVHLPNLEDRLFYERQ